MFGLRYDNETTSESLTIPAAISSMFYGSCGISVLVGTEVTVAPNQQCTGKVWDVDRRTCDPRSTLTVSLPKCHIHIGEMR